MAPWGYHTIGAVIVAPAGETDGVFVNRLVTFVEDKAGRRVNIDEWDRGIIAAYRESADAAHALLEDATTKRSVREWRDGVVQDALTALSDVLPGGDVSVIESTESGPGIVSVVTSHDCGGDACEEETLAF
jgi:hypothetical protein